MDNKFFINNSCKNISVNDELNTVLISMLSVLTIVGANNFGTALGGSWSKYGWLELICLQLRNIKFSPIKDNRKYFLFICCVSNKC